MYSPMRRSLFSLRSARRSRQAERADEEDGYCKAITIVTTHEAGCSKVRWPLLIMYSPTSFHTGGTRLTTSFDIYPGVN
jgi:hypothetical protein